MRKTLAWLVVLVAVIGVVVARRPSSPWDLWPWEKAADRRPVRVSEGPLLALEGGDLVDPQTSLERLPMRFPPNAERLDRDHLVLHDQLSRLYELSTARYCALPGHITYGLARDGIWVQEGNKVGVARPDGVRWSPDPVGTVVGRVGANLIVLNNEALILLDPDLQKVWSTPLQTDVSSSIASLSPGQTWVAVTDRSGHAWTFATAGGKSVFDTAGPVPPAEEVTALLWTGERTLQLKHGSCPGLEMDLDRRVSTPLEPGIAAELRDPPGGVFGYAVEPKRIQMIHKPTGKTIPGIAGCVSPDGRWAVSATEKGLTLIGPDGQGHRLGDSAAYWWIH